MVSGAGLSITRQSWRIGFAPADPLHITVRRSPSVDIGSISDEAGAPLEDRGDDVSSGSSEERLFIRHESAHGLAMANHIRLHSVEIIFYSAASFLVVTGMVLLFLR
jgi:hypothetical protein